jgi:hypothetical protein
MDCDFLPLLPTDDKIQAAGVTGDAARRIVTRRRALEERCPNPTAPGAPTAPTAG